MSLWEELDIDAPEVVEEICEEKEQSLTPFDFANSISYSKENLFADNDKAEKQYNSYIVNRALSFSPDIVLYANEMNVNNHLPKQVQFDFLRFTVRKKKRYDTWIKAEKEEENLKTVKEYYNYSNEKAKYALTILMPDQIDELKSRMFKGGMSEKRRKKKETIDIDG